MTSRWSAWGSYATAQLLSTLPRAESVQFLCRRTGHTDQASLDALAELVGDLPLALEEAAALEVVTCLVVVAFFVADFAAALVAAAALVVVLVAPLAAAFAGVAALFAALGIRSDPPPGAKGAGL